MMTTICSALEAILFAAGEPVEVNRISLILNISEQDVLQAADELSAVFAEEGHSICLVRMEGKLQLCSSPAYASVVGKILEQRKPPMLSPASLETLAVVAYYQPVTAAYISRVRGVDSSSVVNNLVEKGLVEEAGRLDVPGRPIVYRTTPVFLRSFGLSSVAELPPIPGRETDNCETEMLPEYAAEEEAAAAAAVADLPDNEE